MDSYVQTGTTPGGSDIDDILAGTTVTYPVTEDPNSPRFRGPLPTDIPVSCFPESTATNPGGGLFPYEPQAELTEAGLVRNLQWIQITCPLLVLDANGPSMVLWHRVLRP